MSVEKLSMRRITANSMKKIVCIALWTNNRKEREKNQQKQNAQRLKQRKWEKPLEKSEIENSLSESVGNRTL